MAKITRTNNGPKSPLKRHSTSTESATTSDSARDSAKARKTHANHVRANKARASMACERCKHKKVKCEDYIEGKGCEKCRLSNEICYFHRKEVEIKTSFRQGYVENCERECEHLKELVVRMYKDFTEGQSAKEVETAPKDGQPNITSLMHAYGVALGEDYLGTYEARDARLAAEGHQMLTHNGKGDITLPREGSDTHSTQSPTSATDEVSPTDSEPIQSIEDQHHEETHSHSSRSPSTADFTTNSQPMSRQSSAESLFSTYSIPNQANQMQEDLEKHITSPPFQLRQPPAAKTIPSQPRLATQQPYQQFNGVDSWLSMKPNWTPGYSNSNIQGFENSQQGQYNLQSANSQFSPRSYHSQPYMFQQDSLFQGDTTLPSVSADDLQMSGDGFFADNFLQGSEMSGGFDYLDQGVF